MISYRPMWEIMKKNGISQYRLIKEGIDTKLIHELKNDTANITMLTAEKLCRIIGCEINQIVEFKNDDKPQAT